MAVVSKQTHLTPDEQLQLNNLLFEIQDLFQGKKGDFNGEPIDLELVPGATPFYARPFSIPKAYQQITKDEIQRLESIRILTRITSSEWVAPTFIIPKKNNAIHIITDFRGLNKCLKRKPYPMPNIPDMFKGMERFRYATIIDLNMGYYSMALSEESKNYVSFTYPGVCINTMSSHKESNQLQIFSSSEWALCFIICPL
jgi:hypothetical protein